MAENILPEEVIAYLQRLKVCAEKYYQEYIFTKDFLPEETNKQHNNRVTELAAIELTIAQISFYSRPNIGKPINDF